MLITSTTNAGTNNTLDPSLSATFSWVTSPAQAAYEFKWREIKSIVWTGSGKVTSATSSHTVAANTFTKNKHIEWNVRAWDSSNNVSAWYGMDVLISESETKQIINVGDIKLKAVSFGKSKVASKVKFKDPDSSIYELDVVSIDDYSASKVRLSQNGTVQAAAKKLNDYDATTYSDHSNTGNILYGNHTNTGYIAYNNQSGYAAYTNWCNNGYTAYCNHTNTGYSVYSNWCNGGYTAYCNHTNTGYSAYSNWCNYGYGRYSNHSNYKVYIGGGKYSYSQSGYSAYSNWCDAGYGKYGNHSNSGSCGYSNWCNYGYGVYSNHTNSGSCGYSNWCNYGYTAYSNQSGYAIYSNHTNSGYSAYSNHSDSFSRSY